MRSGDLSLRGQVLRPNLLEVLKKDEVEIHLSLSTEGSDKPIKVVKTTDFIEIFTSIVNRLGKPSVSCGLRKTSWFPDRPITLRVTLEPLPSTEPGYSRRQPSAALKNLLIDGSVATVLPVLQAGEKGEHVVPVVFLAKGTYAFRAVAQEVHGDGAGEGLIKFSSVLEVAVE
jgi:hypothetical protein